MEKKYLKFDEQKIQNHDARTIQGMYDNGFVFTRLEPGLMQQTRSLRINLHKYSPNSENRRILKKGFDISLSIENIPYQAYDFSIGKMAKDFYETKADGAFSANKIKELITTSHNFNNLLIFKKNQEILGYAIVYIDEKIMHYCYPFYDLNIAPKDMGLIMMNKAISMAKEKKLEYVYLGSLQRPNDTYKLQFEGEEWFDGESWQYDIEKVKKILEEKHE